MADPEIYGESFIPVVRSSDSYCPLAKELVRASDLLEEGANHSPEYRIIPDTILSSNLADWLLYKARLLDEQFRVWDAEGASVSAEELIEKRFSHALAVAREVNAQIDSDGRFKGSPKKG